MPTPIAMCGRTSGSIQKAASAPRPGKRWRASAKAATEDLAKLELDIDPRKMVSELSASERTGVAIARALRVDPDYPAKLLVLDEPTATLPVNEVDHLLDRGVVIAGEAVISIGDIDLLYLGLNVVLANVDAVKRTQRK